MLTVALKTKVQAAIVLIDSLDLDDVAFGRADDALDAISMQAMLLSLEFAPIDAPRQALAEAVARATIAIKQRSAPGDYALVLMRGALDLLAADASADPAERARALAAATLELDMLAPRKDGGPAAPPLSPDVPVSALLRKRNK